MAENIDDITIQYEENGQVLTEELDKVILSRGAWTTILFRCRQWDAKKEDFGPERYVIKRFRKVSGEFRSQSKFSISSRDQARKIIEALSGWIEEPEA